MMWPEEVLDNILVVGDTEPHISLDRNRARKTKFPRVVGDRHNVGNSNGMIPSAVECVS